MMQEFVQEHIYDLSKTDERWTDVWGFLMVRVRRSASWSETMCWLEWDLLMIEVRRLLIEVRQSAGLLYYVQLVPGVLL